MLTASPGKENTENRHIALLGAFCLFLSAVEYMIPKPLPFMRIGLANLPVMLACNVFPLRAFLILVCVKVLGQALITGTLFSYIFLFSLAGTFCSALLMFFLRRALCERLTFIGIGTAGAVVSNVSQLSLAYVFIFRENVRYIAPVFLAAGLVTGIALGIFCEIFIRRSQWYWKFRCRFLYQYLQQHRENIKGEMPNSTENSGRKKNVKDDKTSGIILPLRAFVINISNNTVVRKLQFLNNSDISAKALFITGLLIMPALLFNPSTEFRVIQFLFFLLLVIVSGKKVNIVFTVLITLFIIAFNLIVPYGKVLFSVGIFRITSGALEAGIHRAVTLQALVMLSKAAVRDDLRLPGAFGYLLGESMRIFSVIISRKKRITAENFITDIDNLMIDLSQEEPPDLIAQKKRTKPAGYVILTVLILLSWLPWVFIIF